MSFISAGAAITLGGTAVYPAISTANGAGSGGAIVVGTKITVGTLTSTGTGAGGAITLGREVIAGAILSTGLAGGAVTLGDECTVTTITSKPLVAPNGGGLITISDDCVTGNIDTTGTVAGTMGGVMIIGDRCELGTLSSTGSAGGAAITLGEGNLFGSIDTQSTASGNGGSLVMTHRNIMVGTVNLSGINNGGAVTLGHNNTFTLSGAIIANGTNGTSGPISIGDGGRFDALTVNAGTTVGFISYGKFCVIGNIIGGGLTSSSGISIGDGCTISGGINLNSPSTGNSTLGNSVTMTGDILNSGTIGSSGSVIVGRGCNLLNITASVTGGGSNSGGITIGASTTARGVRCDIGSGAGFKAGDILIGAGASVLAIRAHAFNALADAGNLVMEPGSSCTIIDVHTTSGIGGSVTLKNANVITSTITMGSFGVGTILSVNSRIQDQIDNVNGTSIFRDLIGSTPAANRDFIANLTASGSQYTNCLIVPNGTGFSIQATVARTVIAYQFLQKNAFPANITLSEGSEITSANLLAP